MEKWLFRSLDSTLSLQREAVTPSGFVHQTLDAEVEALPLHVGQDGQPAQEAVDTALLRKTLHAHIQPRKR